MRIQSSLEFEVVGTSKDSDQVPRMTIRHASTGKEFETTGAVLEAGFSAGDKWLLFITEDIAYEEALHVLLLDAGLNMLDALELSAPYAAGMLRNVSIVSNNRIRFSFFSKDETWCLHVKEKPHIEIWANKHPVRKKSPLFHKAWLVLKRIS